MNNDELMIALWKIKGVKKVLDSLQTSELYEDSSDLFFILSNELQEAYLYYIQNHENFNLTLQLHIVFHKYSLLERSNLCAIAT